MFLIIDDVCLDRTFTFLHFVGASKNNVQDFKSPMGLPYTAKNLKTYIQCMFIY